MKENGKRGITAGAVLILAFALWTILVMFADVKPAGVNGTDIGLSTVNVWFHQLTGVNLWLYNLTDWLEWIAILICAGFAVLGGIQLIRRKSLKKVDTDLLLLGGYYLLIVLAYLVFNQITINYRPILIDGEMELSYPSSTTLLVLSVMPTLKFQADRRTKNTAARQAAAAFAILFSVLMVIGRTVSGVHWLSDIIGSVLLSAGLFLLYRSCVILAEQKKKI